MFTQWCIERKKYTICIKKRQKRTLKILICLGSGVQVSAFCSSFQFPSHNCHSFYGRCRPSIKPFILAAKCSAGTSTCYSDVTSGRTEDHICQPDKGLLPSLSTWMLSDVLEFKVWSHCQEINSVWESQHCRFTFFTSTIVLDMNSVSFFYSQPFHCNVMKVWVISLKPNFAYLFAAGVTGCERVVGLTTAETN